MTPPRGPRPPKAALPLVLLLPPLLLAAVGGAEAGALAVSLVLTPRTGPSGAQLFGHDRP
jgi:hypothetical protein